MGDILWFCIEYAKSGRSKCRLCDTLIPDKSLRAGERVQSMRYDGIETWWFHYHCFFGAPEYSFTRPKPKSPAAFDNFDNLRWNDQRAIINDIAQMDSHHDENFRKRALPDDEIMDAESLKKRTKNDSEEKEMEKQNNMIFDMRDELMKVQPNIFRSLLKIAKGDDNEQLHKRNDENACLVADAMVFGVLKQCEKCSGRFEYVSGLGYRCTGYTSEWLKCEEVTQDPARDEFIVPKILRDSSTFLHSYKPTVRKRIVRVTASSTSTSNSYVQPRYSNTLACLNSSPTINLEKSGKLTLCVTKSGAVDPESDLAGVAHVYERDGVSFTATLSKTCIQLNKNSHYKLQILKHDHLDKYYLFRAWGRIGTVIGDKKCEPLSLDTCTKKFEKYYFKKTGNRWVDRGKFVKHVGKMFPVDTDHGEKICLKADVAINLESELELPVQDLMELIFNDETMARIMTEYKLDLKKMPLGNLSTSQLLEAYEVLTTLSIEMETTAPDDNHALKLKEATNKFYTLIPHYFGLTNPPPFKTQIEIKAKCDMISDLFLMHLAFDLSNHDINSNRIELKNPVDVNYGRLKTDIAVLKRSCKIYNVIERYVNASTYCNQDLEIEDIFVVKRAGEEERYEAFKNFPNRKLLWHGSRAVNMPGILSQGLRIPPPEAPPTTYMFGKGIYFADRAGKAANYCHVNRDNPTGVMLLCEVALGEMDEHKEAKNIEQLPEGKNSTMGLGMRRPDPTESRVTRDGVEVPCGRSILASGAGPWKLEFNEYVVYNPSQIKVRYLLIIVESWCNKEQNRQEVKNLERPTKDDNNGDLTENLTSLSETKSSTKKWLVLYLFAGTDLYSPILGNNMYGSGTQNVIETWMNVGRFVEPVQIPPKLDVELPRILKMSPGS